MRLDLRVRLAIVVAIELAYMAASRFIYHFPELTFAEIETFRTPLRLLAALAFWLLMADVIFSRKPDRQPLRQPLFLVGFVLSCAIMVGIARPNLPAADVLIICLATMPVALHEEVFFRGILQTLLVRQLGVARGVGIMVPVFLAFHIGVTSGDPYNILNIALGGVFFGLVYEKTRSLGAVVILHALGDVLISIPAIHYFVSVSWTALISLVGTGFVVIWARQPPSAA